MATLYADFLSSPRNELHGLQNIHEMRELVVRSVDIMVTKLYVAILVDPLSYVKVVLKPACIKPFENYSSIPCSPLDLRSSWFKSRNTRTISTA